MEEDYYIDNEKTVATVNRFTEMLKRNEVLYFDIYEIEIMFDFFRSQGKNKEASDLVKHAMRLHPYSELIQYFHAELNVDNGEIDVAMPILQKVITLQPNNTRFLQALGDAYCQLGEYKKAVQTFNKALKLMGTGQKALLSYSIGRNFERLERYDDAVKFLNHAVEGAVPIRMAFFDLAFCYEKLERVADSIAAYKTYLSHFPFAEDVWYNLGIAYNLDGQQELALDAYDYCLAIDPDFSSALFNKANLLSDMDRESQAIECYKEFLEFDSKNDQAYLYLGHSYEKIGDFDLARTNYLESLWLNPEADEAHFALSVIFLEKGAYKEGLYHINRALRLDAKNGEYYYAKARLYIMMGNDDAAMAALNLSIEHRPDIEEPWLDLAEILYDSTEYAMAQEVLEKSMVHNYEKAATNYRLAAILLFNQMDKGMQYLEEGLMIDPEKFHEFADWYPLYSMNETIQNLLDNYITNKNNTINTSH